MLPSCGEKGSWPLHTIYGTRSSSNVEGGASAIQSFQEMNVIHTLYGLIIERHLIVNNKIPEDKQLCRAFLGKQPVIDYRG